MRLLPEPPARVRAAAAAAAPAATCCGLDERAMRAIRGNVVAMIFQEPMTSLNPTWTVGFQIEESLRLHTDLGAAARRAAGARAAAAGRRGRAPSAASPSTRSSSRAACGSG